jgi:hypothetical protein
MDQVNGASVAKLNCPGCGAALGVPPPGIQYFACRYCNSGLRLQQSAHGLTLELAQAMGQVSSQIGIVGLELTLQLRYQNLDRDRARAEQDRSRVADRWRYLADEISRLQNHPQHRQFKQAIRSAQAELVQRQEELRYIEAQLTRISGEYDLLKTAERIQYCEQVIGNAMRSPPNPRRDRDIYLARQELGQQQQRYQAISQWLYGR